MGYRAEVGATAARCGISDRDKDTGWTQEEAKTHATRPTPSVTTKDSERCTNSLSNVSSPPDTHYSGREKRGVRGMGCGRGLCKEDGGETSEVRGRWCDEIRQVRASSWEVGGGLG